MRSIQLSSNSPNTSATDWHRSLRLCSDRTDSTNNTNPGDRCWYHRNSWIVRLIEDETKKQTEGNLLTRRSWLLTFPLLWHGVFHSTCLSTDVSSFIMKSYFSIRAITLRQTNTILYGDISPCYRFDASRGFFPPPSVFNTESTSNNLVAFKPSARSWSSTKTKNEWQVKLLFNQSVRMHGSTQGH